MQTLKSLTAIVATGVGLALIASPALAQPLPVPEPGTLSIFAVGVAGAIIVARLRNRK